MRSQTFPWHYIRRCIIYAQVQYTRHRQYSMHCRHHFSQAALSRVAFSVRKEEPSIFTMAMSQFKLSHNSHPCVLPELDQLPLSAGAMSKGSEERQAIAGNRHGVGGPG